MNLDLLKKLTRLANHNPNDNEANSAARRVCKMLEEADFIVNDKIDKTSSIEFTFFDEMVRDDMSWFNDLLKRATQKNTYQCDACRIQFMGNDYVCPQCKMGSRKVG